MTRIADCGAEILAIEAMVGMEQIKHEFAGWIKYFSSVSAFSAGTEPMMHIAIYGPPGHGKTRIARLLGRAFAKSGLLSEPDLFVTASRANLIGRYCGETAIKTTERFDEARGGVIFVDEVYSLGNPEKRDVFTKECIDTINQLLSERTDTLCIIAGYEKEVEESFFSYNPGLARRFPFRFVLPVYSKAELVKIFYRLAEEKKMDIQPLALVAEDLLDLDLPNGGGDMDNLLNKAMIAHQAANFLQPVPHPDINRKEVEIALTQFKTHLHAVKTDPPPPGMYS
jgi:SpoVK/Ycf46/Vps4 family AAA+-type ATPase